MDKAPTHNKGRVQPPYHIYITILLIGALVLLNVFSSGVSLRLVNLSSLDGWFAQSEPARERSSEGGYEMTRMIEEETEALEVLPTDRIMTPAIDQWDRSPIVIEEFRLIFFSIPKVGCTTWKQLFRRIMGAKDWQSQDWAKDLPHNPLLNGLVYLHQYTNLTQIEEMFKSPTWTKAIFVRDPKQRFLSAYLDKVASNKGLFVRNKCCALTAQTRRKCSSVPSCKACWHFARSNVSSFLQTIQTCHDDHWELQSARMDTKYWKYINFVGKMDTMAQDGIRLMERIGAWEKYGKDGWGRHGNGSMFTTTKKQDHTTNAISKMKSYYTPELERQVEEFYKDDYDHPLFGFVKTKVTS